MSTSFKPNFVPSDVVARWPAMALSLWKRSFRHQAPVLLAAALVFKFFPAVSTLFAFLVAPSLFIIAFAIAQMTDEQHAFSWRALADGVLPGAMRLGRITVQFGAIFGLVLAALAGIASSLPPPQARHADGDFAGPLPAAGAMLAPPEGFLGEFLHFCATWTEGVMAMMFLGIFIIAIYQGVFGAVLHAQEGIDARESRLYGWQAWQINSESIAKALREAPTRFWSWLAAIALAIMCSFQTVYLSPVGLIVATFIPCLTYVAYRSIFLGRHENVPAASRVIAARPALLVPAFVR
ncbi:MAG TPA: hypothetical protein VGE12_06840 [Noviherbaspirillum sp.]